MVSKITESSAAYLDSIRFDPGPKMIFAEIMLFLECLELGQIAGVGYAARLQGLARALDILSAWPDKACRDRYMQRIDKQFDLAFKPKTGDALFWLKSRHGCLDIHCFDCDGPFPSEPTE